MPNTVREVAKRQIRILYVLTFVILTLCVYGIVQTKEEAYTSCHHISAVQSYAQSTIDRSLKTLPTIAYYKNPDHKAELANQIKYLREERVGFTPLTCTRSWFIQ